MSAVHEQYLLLFSFATIISSLFSNLYVIYGLLLLTSFQLLLTHCYYGFRIAFFPLIFGFLLVLIFSSLELVGLAGVPPIVYWATFSATYLLTFTLYVLYGKCDFSYLRWTEMGPYGIGYKEFRSNTCQNMVSVYYPISKEEYNAKLHTKYNVPWLPYGLKSLEGISRGSADYGKENHMSTWWFKYLLHVKLDAIQDGRLHPDFAYNQNTIDTESQMSFSTYTNKLVPVIFSHGAISNRTMHSGVCKFLASHGYMVFALDHNDLSSYHTVLPSGHDSFHMNKAGELNLSYRKRQLEQRAQEIMGLVEDLQDQSGIMQSQLGFPQDYFLDLDKLTVVGHSMGGISGLLAANRDKRIRALYMHDGWLFLYQTKIQEEKSLKVDIPLGSISSAGFHEYVLDENYFETMDEFAQARYNTWDSTCKLFNLSQSGKKEGRQQENIKMYGINHIEQSDMAILMPFEVRFLGQGSLPYRDVKEKYMLHGRLVHRFLTNIGFSNKRSWTDEALIQRYERSNILEYERKLC